MRRRQKLTPVNRRQSRMPTQPVQPALAQPSQYRAIRNPTQSFHYPDSLQRLEQYLDRQVLQSKEREELATIEREEKMNRGRRRRAVTETDSDFSLEDRVSHRTDKKMSAVLDQLSSLKGELKELKVSTPRMKEPDQKFDRLLNELVKQRQHDMELMRQQQRNSQPNPYPFFPPYPFQQPYPNQQQQPNSRYEGTKSNFKKTRQPSKKVNWRARKLKKYFRAVAFVFFLRGEAKRLARNRKKLMRSYFLDKFDRDMVHLKNWLLDGLAYSLPVILEKQNLNWCFWDERRQRISEERQGLCLKLVQLGLEKMRKECTTFKVSQFSELLVNLCARGAFAMSRFWSAEEMEHICISQNYGCIRAEESLEQFMVGMVVWVKVLVFNMLLQPHKFDAVNFPPRKEPLNRNMFILGSIYYRLARQAITDHLQVFRPKHFKTGNWLKVQEQFVVECCEPLLFNVDYPEQGEWISGLLGREELEVLQLRAEWSMLVERMKEIGEVLHKEMQQRRKKTVRNHIFKLHN